MTPLGQPLKIRQIGGRTRKMKTQSSIEILRVTTALPLVIVLLAFAADYRSSRSGQGQVDIAAVAYEQVRLPAVSDNVNCF